jgi:SAM-dependent methyltransferase
MSPVDPSSEERWLETYRDAPELFDAFACAQDPERIAYRRLLALARPAGRRVLEIGCGTGRTTQFLAEVAAEVIAIEPRATMLGVAARRVGSGPLLLRARGQALPLGDACIERVFASWVLADLRPETREKLLGELRRVLDPSPGAGIWLLENHRSGEFQALRGRDGDEATAEITPLLEEHRFELVEVIPTELRFPTPERAEEVLGTILGEGARERLRRRPRARVGMNVAILHRARIES